MVHLGFIVNNDLTLRVEPKDIPHSEKLLLEKTFANWCKNIFAVADYSLVPPKDATPPNFTEKTFVQIATKFTKVFSLESFLLYSRWLL